MDKELKISTPASALGKQFVLYRHEDVSGVSGTGIVAEGVEFADGKVALRWYPKSTGRRAEIAKEMDFEYGGSVSIFDTLKEVVAIHGHKGATEAIYVDELCVVPSRTKVYREPFNVDLLSKKIEKTLNRLTPENFGKKLGVLISMIRSAERDSYVRGWNEAVIRNKIETDERHDQSTDEG